MGWLIILLPTRENQFFRRQLPVSYAIMSDTSCNVPMRLLSPEDIQLVPFSFYPKDDESAIAHCIDIDSFDGPAYYKEINSGRLYNTSQVTPQDYYETAASYAKKGLDVLYIGMSSGISGSYNSSLIAKGMLENEGIPTQVIHQNIPYMGISDKLAVELIVNDEDYDRAKKLLEEAENNQKELGEEDWKEVSD